MTETDNCPRCGLTETTKHLLWECVHAKKIWEYFNQLTQDGNVSSYEDVFRVNNEYGTVLIKIKTIQELIQIERPKNWTMEKFSEIIRQLICTEKYNATITKTLSKHYKKWSKYINLES
jgi:hypothetical protein